MVPLTRILSLAAGARPDLMGEIYLIPFQADGLLCANCAEGW